MAPAFRLYGNFHWPPRFRPSDFSETTADGVIEIHFLRYDGKLRRALRWRPGRGPEPAGAPVSPQHDLFDLSPEQAADWFDQNRGNDCAIWIDGEKLPDDGDWLSFRGAFVIEQHRISGASGSDTLDFRWPLLRSCQYAKGLTTLSGVTVGARNKVARFCLDLNLPLPVRRSSAEKAALSDVPVFPFRAVYENTGLTDEGVARPTTLVGGWIRREAIGDDTLGLSGTSFQFNGEKWPSGHALGRFGFAARGKSAQGSFAVYHGNIDDGPIDADKFWPTKSRVLLEDGLASYGFSMDDRPEAWPSLGKGATPSDLSLRFAGTSARNPSFIYRFALSATGTPSDTKADFDKADGVIRMRLEQETGGTLATAETLYVDCRIDWTIADDEIWSTGPDRWWPRVTVAMHWPAPLDGSTLSGTPLPKPNLFDAGLLRHAAHAFRQTLAALPFSEAGQPQSVLPDLAIDGGQTVWFTLKGATLTGRYDETSSDRPASGMLAWGPARHGGASSRRPAMRLTLSDPSDLIGKSDIAADAPQNKLLLRASGQTIFGNRQRLRLALSSAVSDADYFASYSLKTAFAATSWTAKLASLQFDWMPEDNQPERWSDATTLKIGKGTDGHPGPGPAAAAIEFRFPVSAVEPVGVDVHRTEEADRPAPLLIRQTSAPHDRRDTQYWLSITETIAPRADRRIEADLVEQSADAEDTRHIVIDEAPFSILRYTHRPLSARGDISTASVAHYSGDDRIWQYRKVAETYHYSLPPQAIGEGTDKPRRLELHDAPAAAEDPDGRLRPYFKDRKTPEDGNRDRNEDLKRRAVDYRLTPSTEIWIRLSDVERGYFMPEAASHEIFRQHGEYGLGAALSFLRSEFLYGLPVGVDTAQEDAPARFARVAEIEALTGRIVGAPRHTKARPDLHARWHALSDAIARRPQRLEIWARDPESPVAFTPARFTKPALALRGTALHRAPLADLEKPGDLGAWPRSGPRPLPDEAEKDVGAKVDNLPRIHPQGLSGGVLWPVESTNLFNELLRRPQAVGGSIESIALSPCGGEAKQKGAFLDGIVSFVSETRDSHIELQKVEVLGRIGCFWHRARHVVVYKRTASDSAQFAPKTGEATSGSRSRRTILRKINEYIELLEPDRRYPDSAGAIPRTSGFLNAVRFNSKIINVDSAWGEETGDYGFKIPLWNRAGARERPQVYPTPDIAFITAAEGDGDTPVVAQECLDPDNLFFFADVKSGTSDTDAWITRLGIDYANVPSGRALADVADHANASSASTNGASGSVSDRRRRSVGLALPGLDRFTWRLAPAARRTAINAQRSAAPVYVGLASLSFMRAGHSGSAATMDLYKNALAYAAKIPEPGAAEGGMTVNIDALSFWGKSATTEAPALNAHSEAVHALLASLKKGDEPGAKAAFESLKNAWETGDLPGALKAKLMAAAGEAGPILKNLGDLAPLPTGDENPCAVLKDKAIGTLRRKEMLILTTLSDWTSDIRHALPTLASGDKNALIEALADSIRPHLQPIFADLRIDLGGAEEATEKARAVIASIETDIEATATGVRQRVRQFSAGYDRSKPWSPSRYQGFAEGLSSAASNLALDVQAHLDDARQRLATQIGDASQALSGHLSKYLATTCTAGLAGFGDPGGFAEAVREMTGPLHDGLNALSSDAGDGVFDVATTGLPALRDEIVQDANLPQDLREKAVAVLTAALENVPKGQAYVRQAHAQLVAMEALTLQELGSLRNTVMSASAAAGKVAGLLDALIAEFAALADKLSDAGFAALAARLAPFPASLQPVAETVSVWLRSEFLAIADSADMLVAAVMRRIDTGVARIIDGIRSSSTVIDTIVSDIEGALGGLSELLGPDRLLTVMEDAVVRPALAILLAPLPEALPPALDHDALTDKLQTLNTEVSRQLRLLDATALGAADAITSICSAAFQTVGKHRDYLGRLAGETFEAYADEILGTYAPLASRIEEGLKDFGKNAAELAAAIETFDRTVRGLQNDLSRSLETARLYGQRVMSAVARMDVGNPAALPSNILKLYSAVSSAPEIAALTADIDRIRSTFDDLTDIVSTTETTAFFDRIGNELKALGLTIPFDRIGDRLLPVDLSRFDIGKIFGNLGGIDLGNLFKGYRLPENIGEAVRISHGFDKAQARAWVQIDIDAPMPGRRSLFCLGALQTDFVDMRARAQVRMEASKDSEAISQTGFSRIDTTIDVVAGGQSMVAFEKFALRFSRESGLDIDFDPKNIRLNPAFRFIQDYLSALFPDAIGQLDIIKQDGMPIGMEHAFAMPPMTVNFGTSGVSNIAIANHFKLLAHPDFVIANRFNLSTAERPFLFSIFIIGGTGYMQIETDYRPIDGQLMVAIEAAAGGSAALAFAVGPFEGQVFITLSGMMRYRKMIGQSGGGLSLAMIIVAAGHVRVCGIVTVGITLMLRMIYRDNGDIEGQGTLSVSIRISRFFKITARANVNYTLRGGRAETSSSLDIDKSGAAAKFDAARKSVQQLQNARG